MAVERNVTQDDKFFLGERKRYRVTITGVNVTGMAFRFMLKRNVDDPDSAALLTKDCELEDAANGVLDVEFFAEDTNKTKPQLTADDVYHYSIKRTDDDSETIATFGTWQFRAATQR